MYRVFVFYMLLILTMPVISHAESADTPLRSESHYQPDLNKFPLLFNIEGLSGSDLSSDVMIIHFFGSWCSGYPGDHTTLKTLTDQHDIPVYGINIMEKEQDEAKVFLEEHGNPYTAWGKDSYSLIANSMGVIQALTTLIITKDGIIHWRTDKALNETVINEEILPLIQELRKEYPAKSITAP